MLFRFTFLGIFYFEDGAFYDSERVPVGEEDVGDLLYPTFYGCVVRSCSFCSGEFRMKYRVSQRNRFY